MCPGLTCMLSQGFFLTEISLNGLKFSLLNNNTSLCRWLKLLSPVANMSSIILPAVSRWPYLNNNNSFIIFTNKIMGLQLLPPANDKRTNPRSIPTFPPPPTQDMGLHYKGTTRPQTDMSPGPGTSPYRSPWPQPTPDMGPHCIGTTPNVFKLVYYEARTVGKRAVRILPEYFLFYKSFDLLTKNISNLTA